MGQERPNEGSDSKILGRRGQTRGQIAKDGLSKAKYLKTIMVHVLHDWSMVVHTTCDPYI